MYNNAPNEGMRCIKALCQTFIDEIGEGSSYTVFDVRAKNELPDIDSFDAFISSGGPGTPLPSGEPWELRFFHLVNQIISHNRENAHKKHLFLICHSFQMVAHHLNLGTITKRKSTAFGIFPMHKTKQGLEEPYFEFLPNPFHAVDSRDYQLIQPNYTQLERIGAEVLCLEKIRPHVPLERAIMAIRFSPEVIGTQFHPEADSNGMLKYFGQDEKREAVIKNHGKDKLDDMVTHLNDPDKIMLTESVIIPSFLRYVANQLAYFE